MGRNRSGDLGSDAIDRSLGFHHLRRARVFGYHLGRATLRGCRRPCRCRFVHLSEARSRLYRRRLLASKYSRCFVCLRSTRLSVYYFRCWRLCEALAPFFTNASATSSNLREEEDFATFRQMLLRFYTIQCLTISEISMRMI